MKLKLWDTLCNGKEVSDLAKKCIEQLNSKLDLFGIHLFSENSSPLKKLLKEALSKHNSQNKENKINYSKLAVKDYEYLGTHFANQVIASFIGCTTPKLKFSHEGLKTLCDVTFPPELIQKRKNDIWGKTPQDPLVHTTQQWEVVIDHCVTMLEEHFKTNSVSNFLFEAVADWKLACVEYDKEVEKEILQVQEGFHKPSCG